MTLQITSSAFAQGHVIPKKYTGEGADVSPPLAWSDLPEKTKELALVCDDPDAPTAEPWVHWVIYKIPATAKGLPEGVTRKAALERAGRRAAGQELLAGRRQYRLPRSDAPARPRRSSLLFQALRVGRADRGRAEPGQEGRLGEDSRPRVGGRRADGDVSKVRERKTGREGEGETGRKTTVRRLLVSPSPCLPVCLPAARCYARPTHPSRTSSRRRPAVWPGGAAAARRGGGRLLLAVGPRLRPRFDVEARGRPLQPGGPTADGRQPLLLLGVERRAAAGT